MSDQKQQEDVDKRLAVIYMIYPPESLRDASIEKIRRVVYSNAEQILNGIAFEIQRWFTSAPLDPGQAQRVAEAVKEIGADASESGK